LIIFFLSIEHLFLLVVGLAKVNKTYYNVLGSYGFYIAIIEGWTNSTLDTILWVGMLFLMFASQGLGENVLVWQ